MKKPNRNVVKKLHNKGKFSIPIYQRYNLNMKYVLNDHYRSECITTLFACTGRLSTAATLHRQSCCEFKMKSMKGSIETAEHTN